MAKIDFTLSLKMVDADGNVVTLDDIRDATERISEAFSFLDGLSFSPVSTFGSDEEE